MQQLPPGSPESFLICSKSEVDKAIEDVAKKVTTALANVDPLVITVLNGGLYFTGKLLPLLKFPLQQDYLDATRYGNQTQGNELQWYAYPRANLRERVVLLVDDIFDRGFTLEAIYSFCKQRGAAEVYSAVLIKKQFSITPDSGYSNYRPDFTGLVCDDNFVIGCGMDYQGYGRNIEGIYGINVQDIAGC